MFNDFREHINHYAVLIAGVTVGIWTLIRWRYVATTQLWIVVVMAVGYVLWGVVHHGLIKDLSGKIVLEYGLIAGIFVLIYWFGVYWA